jgi:glycerol-3-phosphate O-acyltransferase
MGGAKERESFGWFLKLVRNLRRKSGNIHIRFGEPLSLAAALGPPDPAAEPNDDEQSLVVQKLAFEVSVRINRATPITPTSLVTLALLGNDQALTVEETLGVLRNWVDDVRARRLPTTVDLDLDTPEGARAALDELVESGVVAVFAEGPEPVYRIGPDQHLAAAYYRNTIIHFFVDGAIAELGLVRATEDDVVDPTAEFWSEVMRLRDLLKFEFFFADKDAFREEVGRGLGLHDARWQERLAAGGGDGARALLQAIRPFTAHRVLRPFLEAYRVVGDALERQPLDQSTDEKRFVAGCLALGKQYVLQRRIRSAESVSKVLFETAVRLAKNRNLLDGASSDVALRRRQFADEIRDAVRRVDAIDALAASRRAGLIS